MPCKLTVASMLRDIRARLRTAGFEDDAVEAEAIVCHSLAVEPAWLYANPEALVSGAAAPLVEECLRRRLGHEPLAYITGVAHFYGREFAIDRRVLVPRPETELLVELARTAERSEADLERRQEPEAAEDSRIRVADIGTGSGILAVTLALELPHAEVQAVDASDDALQVAHENALRHGVEGRIHLRHGHLGSPLSGRFQIVVANLPYIRSGDLQRLQPELQFEPRSALDGGDDGLKFIGPLIDDLPRLLAKPGLALLEIDPPIATAAFKRAQATMPGARVIVLKDLAWLDRVLQISL